MSKCTFSLLAAAAAGLMSTSAHAGFYATITPDGDTSDWASVPVATTISANTGTPIDFASLKIANDATNVYFLITYNTAVNPQSGSACSRRSTAITTGRRATTFLQRRDRLETSLPERLPVHASAGNFNSGEPSSVASYGLRRTRPARRSRRSPCR